MNGSIGTVVDIVYREKEGPTRNPKSHPAYVVVDFKDSTIPTSDALWQEGKPTLVPVPVSILRCEKQCCSEQAIPLRVAKAVSTYKSQGMTAGEGEEVFEKVVVALPTAGGKKTPSAEHIGRCQCHSPNASLANRLPFWLSHSHPNRVATNMNTAHGAVPSSSSPARIFMEGYCYKEVHSSSRSIRSIKEINGVPISASMRQNRLKNSDTGKKSADEGRKTPNGRRFLTEAFSSHKHIHRVNAVTNRSVTYSLA